MTCNNCGNTVKLRSEFCPQCGERLVYSMDDIIASSQSDAATRYGDALDSKLRLTILGLLVLLALTCGFVYLFDSKLDFDGSALPSISANAPLGAAASNATLVEPFVEPRPMPPLPPTTVQVLGYRKNPLRAALRSANGGGGHDFDGPINAGLNFLAQRQDKEGGWPVAQIPGNVPLDATADTKWGKVGVSSLVLMAFLGDGHTWIKDDAGARSPHGEVVRRGVRYLLAAQDVSTGRIGAGEGHFMYNHAMATAALCEAAALTGDAELNGRAKLAAGYLIKTQTDRGGWDYYGHSNSELDDISVSAWCVQALATAYESGINVPVSVFEKSLTFYRQLTKGERGVYNFQPDDMQFVPARSGMVLMMRQLLGDGPANPDIKQLASKLTASIPKVKDSWGHGWNPKFKDALERSAFDPYMMYFCYHGMFFVGGREWQEWNPKASKALFDMQDADGAWRTNDVYSKQGGTCYSTALCILALQAHHRIVHSVNIKSTAGTTKEE